MNFYLMFLSNYKVSVLIFITLLIIGVTDRYYNYYEPTMSGHSGYSLRPTVQYYRRFIEKNQDMGSSFTVYNGSVRVLDLTGGYVDVENQLKWDRNTITQLFMTSHIVGVITIAILVDKELLNYNDTLGKIIPDIHASLKLVTVRDVMTHQTGMPYFQDSLTTTNYRDNIKMSIKKVLSTKAVLENSPLIHKYSQALILDAIVMSADPQHRTVSQYFSEEVAQPNSLDILIGLPRTQQYRVARIYRPSLRHLLYSLGKLDLQPWMNWVFGESELKMKVANSFKDIQINGGLTADQLEIPLCSNNVFSNSDNIAKLFSLLFYQRSTQKHNLIKNETLSQLISPALKFYDEVLQSYVTMTTGGLMTIEMQDIHLYGWRDETGQFVWTAPSLNLSFAYSTNHLRAGSYNRDTIFSTLSDSIIDIFQ